MSTWRARGQPSTPLNELARISRDVANLKREKLPAAGGGSSSAVYEIQVVPYTDGLLVGDGQFVFAIPLDLNGFSLSAVAAYVNAVSTINKPTVQIRNQTTTADMLTTRITIDTSEFTSYTAAVPAVIDASNKLVSTADMVAVDIDNAGFNALGLGVILTFSP